MTPACREAYRYWGPLPSQSTTLWAYIAFRFLLVLVPLPEVLALSKKMAAESNRDLEVRHPFATLRTCPICPEEYILPPQRYQRDPHGERHRIQRAAHRPWVDGPIIGVIHWRRDLRESPVAFLQAGRLIIPVTDVPGMVNGGVRCQMWCAPGNQGL
jgi:hypothetical protein